MVEESETKSNRLICKNQAEINERLQAQILTLENRAAALENKYEKLLKLQIAAEEIG